MGRQSSGPRRSRNSCVGKAAGTLSKCTSPQKIVSFRGDACGEQKLRRQDYEMSQGFSIGGHIPASPAFRKKLTGATLAVSDLRKMAPVVRKGILRSAQSSRDPDLDKALYDSTEEELRKGWLWGPVAESSLSNTSSVTRRSAFQSPSTCQSRTSSCPCSHAWTTTSSRGRCRTRRPCLCCAGLCRSLGSLALQHASTQMRPKCTHYTA